MTMTLQHIYDFARHDMSGVDALIKNSLVHQSQPIEVISNYIISAGGKRIRPLMVILTSKMFGYSGINHIKIATALEFIHTATLFHDDVIDDGKTRRGKPTANNVWGNKYAILVGDFLFSQAFKLMVQTEKLEILEVLSHSSSVIAAGEIEQLSCIGNLSLNEAQYIKIITDKTAELFAAACKSGAIIAEQNIDVINKMYDFGLNTGIAFQIIDDIIDYTSLESGKDLGQDVKDKKVTLPLLLAYQAATPEEKEVLEQILSSEYEDNHLIIIKDIIKKYSTISLSKNHALSYINKAEEILETVNKTQDFKEMFSTLLKHQLSRIS